jgi:hypothetical protein
MKWVVFPRAGQPGLLVVRPAQVDQPGLGRAEAKVSPSPEVVGLTSPG